MNKLHPGARWLFRFSIYRVLILFLIFLLIFSFLIFVISKSYLGDMLSVLLSFSFYILPTIVIAEIYARMSYNRYLYEIGKNEIKIEQGIIWKKYTSIPYERVQNIEIHRGIIARIFGFSTVDIETAGQSGNLTQHRQHGPYFKIEIFGFSSKYKSEGHLPAISIDGAEKIREFVMKKIKQKHGKGQGL